jgi:hypothetical protein
LHHLTVGPRRGRVIAASDPLYFIVTEPVTQMEPIVAEAKRLRTLRPELDGELEAYAGNLGELQVALQHTRVMLIARLANMEALRGHLETVGLWTAALRQTR